MVCRPRNRAGPSRAAQEPIRIWFLSTPAVSFSAGNKVALTSSNTNVAAQYLYKCSFILLLVAVQNSTFWACFRLKVQRSDDQKVTWGYVMPRRCRSPLREPETWHLIATSINQIVVEKK